MQNSAKQPVIIDAHAHLGYSKIFSMGITEEELLGTMDRFGIGASVVMPAAGAEYSTAHDAIARLADKYPGRIFGMASLTPLVGEDVYTREVRRCVRELGFRGLKLHPLAHAVMPLAPVADVVFSVAAELNIPVMVHTGTGIPFSLPSVLIPRAQEYPQLPIILAHAGFAVYTVEAFVAARVCPNIYLEPSWCMASDIKRLVDEFGAQRVMYGGDLPSNVPVELAKFQNLGLSSESFQWCMAGTANKVFRLGLSVNVEGGE
jgi:predicted TIM-barrel fold metal-dependent hydrolase